MLNSFYTIKYLIHCSAALYILVAFSIDKLKIRHQTIVVIIILLISTSILYLDFNSFQKEKWSEVAYYLKEKKNFEDAVVFHVYNSIYPFTYYFDPGCFKSDNISLCLSLQNIYGVEDASKLPKEAINKENVWLILFNWWYVDKEGEIYNYFNSRYRLVEHKKYPDIEVYYFSSYGK